MAVLLGCSWNCARQGGWRKGDKPPIVQEAGTEKAAIASCWSFKAVRRKMNGNLLAAAVVLGCGKVGVWPSTQVLEERWPQPLHRGLPSTSAKLVAVNTKHRRAILGVSIESLKG